MGAELFYILLILVCCKQNVGDSQKLMITDGFKLTVLGKGQCPDPVYVGSSAWVVSARSQLDCARWCSSLEDCNYHSYEKNEKMCNLYTSTPDRYLPTPGCNLMVVGFHDDFKRVCVYSFN